MKHLKNTKPGIVKGAALALFATALILAVSTSAQNNNKVVICHIPPGNEENMNELSVSPNAVTAHLAHGDKVGVCHPEPPEEIFTGMAF